jgi:hypothetical protein
MTTSVQDVGRDVSRHLSISRVSTALLVALLVGAMALRVVRMLDPSASLDLGWAVIGVMLVTVLLFRLVGLQLETDGRRELLEREARQGAQYTKGRILVWFVAGLVGVLVGEQVLAAVGRLLLR